MAIEIMAEGASGPGPEGLPGQQPALPSGTEPKSLSPNSYEVRREGAFNVYVNPDTGREAVRLPIIAGGAGDSPEPGQAAEGRTWDTLTDEEKKAIEEEFPPDVIESMKGWSRAVFSRWYGVRFPSPQPGSQGEQSAANVARRQAEAGGVPPENPPPEGPRGPEGPLSPDYLWSPEFRAERWKVVKELVRLESLPYEEIYDGGENEAYITWLYSEWKRLEALDNQKSSLRRPFDPKYLEPERMVPEKPRQPEDPLTDLPSFKEVLEAYNNASSLGVLAEAKNHLSRYFNEAKRMSGLLNGIDESLKELYAEMMQGMEVVSEEGEGRQRRRLTKVQIMDRVEKDRQAVSKLGTRAFRELKRSDPANVDLAKIAKFDGIWEEYADLAVDRFALLLNGGGIIKEPHIPGEFNFDLGDVGPEGAIEYRRLAQDREIYWRPTWANYYEVSARTPEQFRIASESFMRWMRTGLGKAPDELVQKINGFKEAITSAGQRAGLEEYTVGLRLELEAIMGVIGADFSNERYNADYFKQFWTFIAKDQGPDRMLKLSETARGVMAAVLHKFDKDPRFELLFSPHGSRGQLMGRERNAIEMDELQNQIKAMLVAEVMGITMKRYHPDDPEKRLSDKMFEANLVEIHKFKSDEDFENLYEGFHPGDQEELYKVLSTRQRITERVGEVQKMLTEGTPPSGLKGEDKLIYDYLQSGKTIDELKPAEKLTLVRLERVRRIQQALEGGLNPDKLEGEDKVMYGEAKNAVDLAYELYGAMGEKAKRGGGVFLVDRKDENDNEFRDYIPNHWAEKFVHFAENWTKAEYGHLQADDLKYKVDQARRMAIWALKAQGFNAKLYDFTLLKDRKPVDPNTLGYHPSYGAKRDATNLIDKFRYAVPVNSRILGYNTKGEEVILAFDDDGEPVTLEYDSDGLPTGSLVPLEYDKGQAVIFDKPDKVSKKIRGEWVKVVVKDRKRIIFDNLNKPIKAKPMLLKRPAGEIDPQTRKLRVTGVDKVPVDFQTATHHIYSRWTGHPYWGYQEEDTGLILASEAFDAAKEIKSGRLRWEDAPPHAVQLLIVDPTLERVAHFDLEGLETLINLAAVEESYQAHWRIGDELYENFFSPDASRLKNRTAYVLQDHGGSTKQWFHARAEAALWPDAKVRRLRTFIPYIPLHFASMSEMWGAPGGALDVFRMMGYKKYRMVGQFAMDKWVNQTGGAQALYEALFDWYSEQEKKLKEGLGRKLNNEADTLRKFHRQYSSGDLGNLPDKVITTAEETDEDFLKTFRDTLGRPEVVMNRNTVLESVFRGERAPLHLEGIEIFQRRPDGTYILDRKNNRILNPRIDWNRNSGSGRHSNERFVWRYVRLLRSDDPREGQELYAGEAQYYELGDAYTIASMRLAKKAKEAGDPKWEGYLETRFEWYDGKANN